MKANKYDILGKSPPQDELSKNSILFDELTNHQDITSVKKTELETNKNKGKKEEQKKGREEDCSSDAEYESFGETIDENDEFEDLDPLLEDDNQKYATNSLKVLLRKSEVSSNANSLLYPGGKYKPPNNPND